MYFCWLESGMISVGYKVLLNRKLLSTKVGFVLSRPDCSEACILGPIGDNTGEALPTECVMVRITYLSHDLSYQCDFSFMIFFFTGFTETLIYLNYSCHIWMSIYVLIICLEIQLWPQRMNLAVLIT